MVAVAMLFAMIALVRRNWKSMAILEKGPNSTEGMSIFEADEHLRGRHALIYVGASYA